MILQLDVCSYFCMFVYSYQNIVQLLSKSHWFWFVSIIWVFSIPCLNFGFKMITAIKASAIRKEICHCETSPDLAW